VSDEGKIVMQVHPCVRVLCSILAAGVVTIAAAARTHAADAEAGLGLVKRYCDVCHAVGQAPNPPNLAPPLLDLAQQTSATGAWLRAWLKAPHPALPAALSEKQIDDVIAYLAGLAAAGPR
jgi:mono/diheme cytochrome c family protein